MEKHEVSVLKAAIVEDDYQTIEKLVYSLAWSFHRRYGDQIEEWFSICNIASIEAINSFDNERAQLQTHVYNKIRWRCYDVLREKARSKETITDFTDEQTLNQFTFVHNTYRRALYDLIERDYFAHTIYKLIIDPPNELLLDFDSKDPDCIRDAICMYCRCKLKWSSKVVQRTIQELREVLT